MLYNCTTEFRLYWLRDKLSEGSTTNVSSANPYRFVVSSRSCCEVAGMIYGTHLPSLSADPVL